MVAIAPESTEEANPIDDVGTTVEELGEILEDSGLGEEGPIEWDRDDCEMEGGQPIEWGLDGDLGLDALPANDEFDPDPGSDDESLNEDIDIDRGCISEPEVEGREGSHQALKVIN